MAGRRRRQPWIAPGDGRDHITGLPLELRARIASFLPFRQVGQLSSLSRPWCRIHDHTPVVRVDISDFFLPTGEYHEEGPLVFLHEDALAGLEAALLRRAEDDGPGSSKVEALWIKYGIHEPLIRYHAVRIIALADAREVCVEIPNRIRPASVAWGLNLPSSARDVDVLAFRHLAPTIAGPGAAALEILRLQHVVVREWPRLPSLRILNLDIVTVEAPFRPGTWWPQLEELCICVSEFELARLDIRLPLLKVLEMDDVIGPVMDVTVVAPELEELYVSCGLGDRDYGSFTLRAPRLRCLRWRNQFTERVDISVGRPGSVKAGFIELASNGGFDCREMKECRALMMRMLQGLLPELTPEQVADRARPHITHDKYNVDYEGKLVPEEKIICDLDALMSLLQL